MSGTPDDTRRKEETMHGKDEKGSNEQYSRRESVHSDADRHPRRLSESQRGRSEEKRRIYSLSEERRERERTLNNEHVERERRERERTLNNEHVERERQERIERLDRREREREREQRERESEKWRQTSREPQVRAGEPKEETRQWSSVAPAGPVKPAAPVASGWAMVEKRIEETRRPAKMKPDQDRDRSRSRKRYDTGSSKMTAPPVVSAVDASSAAGLARTSSSSRAILKGTIVDYPSKLPSGTMPIGHVVMEHNQGTVSDVNKPSSRYASVGSAASQDGSTLSQPPIVSATPLVSSVSFPQLVASTPVITTQIPSTGSNPVEVSACAVSTRPAPNADSSPPAPLVHPTIVHAAQLQQPGHGHDPLGAAPTHSILSSPPSAPAPSRTGASAMLDDFYSSMQRAPGANAQQQQVNPRHDAPAATLGTFADRTRPPMPDMGMRPPLAGMFGMPRPPMTTDMGVRPPMPDMAARPSLPDMGVRPPMPDMAARPSL